MNVSVEMLFMREASATVITLSPSNTRNSSDVGSWARPARQFGVVAGPRRHVYLFLLLLLRIRQHVAVCMKRRRGRNRLRNQRCVLAITESPANAGRLYGQCNLQNRGCNQNRVDLGRDRPALPASGGPRVRMARQPGLSADGLVGRHPFRPMLPVLAP